MTERWPGYYRVGRRCPWNIYQMTFGDPDNDQRFAVAFDPEDGPRIVAALNAAIDRGALPHTEPAPFSVASFWAT